MSFSVAAIRLGVAPDGLRTSDGTVVAPDGRVIALAGLATSGVAAAGSFANSKSTYAYGTAAAHVTALRTELDAEPGAATARERAARERAAREREARLQRALAELSKVQARQAPSTRKPLRPPTG